MTFGKDNKGVIIRESRTQALGALGISTGIIIGTKLATLERFRMLKSELMVTITGLTSGQGTGLNLYLVDGDFSLAEFEAAIEGNGPLGPNDAIQEPISERFEKWCGSTENQSGSESELQVRNEDKGGLLTVMPRWTFARTKSWNWILYNAGAVLTTGATVFVKAKSFGVWVT